MQRMCILPSPHSISVLESWVNIRSTRLLISACGGERSVQLLTPEVLSGIVKMDEVQYRMRFRLVHRSCRAPRSEQARFPADKEKNKCRISTVLPFWLAIHLVDLGTIPALCPLH